MADSHSPQKAVARQAQKAKAIDGGQEGPPNESRLAVHEAVEYFQGPIPPPNVLGEYDKMLPGAADRIVSMAEAQASHRRNMEEVELHSDVMLEARGQLFGFVLAVVSLGGGMVLVGLDKTLLGTAAVIGAVAALVGLFVWARGKGRDLSPPKRRSE